MAYLDNLRTQVDEARARVALTEEAIKLQSIRSNKSRIDPSSPTRLSIGERLLQHRMEVPLVVSPDGNGAELGRTVPFENDGISYDDVLDEEGKASFASGWGPGGLSQMMNTRQGGRSRKSFGSRW